MLDWSKYTKQIDLYTKFSIEELYTNIIGYSQGVCYNGGHDSYVIIKNDNRGIKIYKPNISKISNLLNFNTKIKNLIYDKHDHIQNVYEMKSVKNFTYAIQEWIEGETLLEIYNNKNLEIVKLNLILNDLYIKILIPLWSRGIIWVQGCLSNFCLNDKLVMIDTDNMYKTYPEILNTPNIYTIRNKARSKNFNRHSELIYRLCTIIKPITNSKFNNIFSKLNCIYFSDIDEHYYDNSIDYFCEFLSDLNKFLND